MNRIKRALAACALLALGAPTSAAVVTYDWVAGDWSGTLSYDTAGAPTGSQGTYTGPDTGYKWYGGPGFVTTAQYNGTYWYYLGKQYNLPNQLSVENDYYGQDQLEFYSSGGPTGYFNLVFTDPTSLALSNKDLPSSIHVGLFSNNRLVLGGGNADLPFTSFIAEAAPEPESWTLMLGGFLALGTVARIARRAAFAG